MHMDIGTCWCIWSMQYWIQHFLMHQLTIDCCFVCFLLPSWLHIFPAACLHSMSQWLSVFAGWLLCPMLPLLHGITVPYFLLAQFFCFHCAVAQEIIFNESTACSAHRAWGWLLLPYTSNWFKFRRKTKIDSSGNDKILHVLFNNIK